MPDVPICPTCSKPATATATRFGTRHSCCGLWSWEGKPLVDEATHNARKAAHAAFDSLWKHGPFSRAGAYKALAAIMGVKPADCHIALMSKEDAERVVAFAPRLRENAKHKVDRLGSNFIGLNPW